MLRLASVVFYTAEAKVAAGNAVIFEQFGLLRGACFLRST
jgi:hypothetical protein